MANKLQFYILVSALITTQFAFAELRDPTRPEGFIESAAIFEPSAWQLNAVIISHQRKIAIINGKLFKIGDKLAGQYLSAITLNSVDLEGPGGKMTLFLIPPIKK